MIAANTTPPSDDEPKKPVKADREPNGFFAKGNKLASGNLNNKKIHALRKALLEAVTQNDIKTVVKKLIEKAKAGDVIAARELLDRCLGKATQPIETDGPGAIAAIQIVYAEDWYGSKAASATATDAAPATSFAER